MLKATKLAKLLDKPLGLHKARIKFLSYAVLALIKSRSVNLVQIAQMMETKASSASNYRRLQRFFSQIKIPQGRLAYFNMSLLGLLSKPAVLVFDRTNWKLGKRHINLLFLCAARKQCDTFILERARRPKAGKQPA